jgi:hypothetical protein
MLVNIFTMAVLFEMVDEGHWGLRAASCPAVVEVGFGLFLVGWGGYGSMGRPVCFWWFVVVIYYYWLSY